MDTRNMKSITYFDIFPTEIIFIIFDYLSNNDIIYTFIFFSQRLNRLLFENKRYINYLILPKINIKPWKNILSVIGSQIDSLNINSVNISFPLAYFSNLKSLIISSPHGFADEELKSIFESHQFNNLHSFQIQEIKIFCENSNDYYRYHYNSQDYVLKKVFNNKNSLKTFEYSLITSPLAIKDTNTFETNINLHSLTLILTDFKDIYSLISYTPNLEYLKVQSESPYLIRISPNKINIKLKELHLKLDQKQRIRGYQYWYEGNDFDQLTNFIKQFSSSLICLSLDLFKTKIYNPIDFPFNSIKLQQLLETMIKLKQFHLIAVLYDSLSDYDTILLTFNDQFWSDHNWSFGIYDKYFFTLPFYFDYFDVFYEVFNNVKSNNPEILINNCRIWYSIKSINISLKSISDFNILKELQIKMPKLTTINFNYTYYLDELEYFSERKEVCLNSVTTVYLESHNVEKSKDWLIYLLPNLKHLILSSRKLPLIESELIPILNNKIQQLDIYIEFIDDEFDQLIKTCYVYFSNVEHIHFRSKKFFSISKKGTDIIMKVLENFKNLRILIIYNLEYSSRFDDVDWNIFIEDFNMNEIKKTYQVNIFQRYVLFSKKT